MTTLAPTPAAQTSSAIYHAIEITFSAPPADGDCILNSTNIKVSTADAKHNSADFNLDPASAVLDPKAIQKFVAHIRDRYAYVIKTGKVHVQPRLGADRGRARDPGDDEGDGEEDKDEDDEDGDDGNGGDGDDGDDGPQEEIPDSESTDHGRAPNSWDVLHEKLMWAVQDDDVEGVRKCLQAGAKPYDKAKAGDWSPIDLAIYGNGKQKDIFDLLLDHTTYFNMMYGSFAHTVVYAARRGRTRELKLLLQRHLDLADQIRSGALDMALEEGIDEGSHEIVRILVAHGAKFTKRKTRYSKYFRRSVPKMAVPIIRGYMDRLRGKKALRKMLEGEFQI